METLATIKQPAIQHETIGLKTLVNRLVTGLVPTTVRNKSFMLNDVPAELNLKTNSEMVATVLSKLFHTVAAHSTDSCIRISAKVYSDVVLVQVRDQNTRNTYTKENSLGGAQPIAEKIGGFLGITSQRKNETIIVFSFPNLPAAA